MKGGRGESVYVQNAEREQEFVFKVKAIPLSELFSSGGK